MENQDKNVSGLVAGVVMLAAVFTTYTTYSSYQDDKLAAGYESDEVALDQTASALVSLRAMSAMTEEPATTTEATTTAAKKK